MQSRPVKYTLGPASRIAPKTLGEPGRRTFNLELEAGSALCVVWLEKELLLQLGIRLQETVARLSSEEKERSSKPPDPADLQHAFLEFQRTDAELSGVLSL